MSNLLMDIPLDFYETPEELLGIDENKPEGDDDFWQHGWGILEEDKLFLIGDNNTVCFIHNRKEIMKEFYSFRFPTDDENAGLFAEFLPEPDGTVALFASQYPHPISENLEEAQEGLKELTGENPDIVLEIVKIELQITPVT